MKRLLLLLAAALAGCSTYSGVYPTGADTFSVSGSNKRISSANDIVANLYKEAAGYCGTQGKKFVSEKVTTQDGTIARRSSAKLDFKCVANQ